MQNCILIFKNKKKELLILSFNDYEVKEKKFKNISHIRKLKILKLLSIISKKRVLIG